MHCLEQAHHSYVLCQMYLHHTHHINNKLFETISPFTSLMDTLLQLELYSYLQPQP